MQPFALLKINATMLAHAIQLLESVPTLSKLMEVPAMMAMHAH